MSRPAPQPSDGVVFVVDDDLSVREALSALLRSIGLRVELFASAQEFLAYTRPDAASCLVLDVRLPGLNGLELQRELKRLRDYIPVIFITGHGDIPMSVRAMKAGAAEFLPKPFHDSDLVDAIQQALARHRMARQVRAQFQSIQDRYDVLTAREREVLPLIVRGLLNKQAAAKLGVSEVTVKVHRRHIMQKLHAGSLAELVRIAEKLGVTGPAGDNGL